MVDILAKEAPSSPEEVTQFFMRVHDAKPGITERWLEEIKTEDGRSSYAMLCEAGEPLAGKTVVDLACGSGPLTVLLASRVGNSGRVIGVDLNSNELCSAQVKFSSAPNVQFLNESVQQLSLPSSSVDVVLCHMAFMLFNPVKPVVREISRILKPGGMFAALGPALGPTASLYSELVTKMTGVLREEIAHFETLSWGQPEAKTLSGLQQLFSTDLDFCAEIQTTDFDLIIRGAPQQLPEKILQSFYYAALLSEEGAARLKAEWQTLLEHHKEKDGTVAIPMPRSIFRVSKDSATER